MKSYEDEWQFDTSETRERFTQAPRGQTENVGFRAFLGHLRIVDEAIQSRRDPRIKTRSDVLQDALMMWIEDWAKNYAEQGVHGTFLRELNLNKAKAKRERRKYMLDLIDADIEEAKQDKDVYGLQSTLRTVQEERDSLDEHCPQSYISQLDERIESLQEMLRRENPR